MKKKYSFLICLALILVLSAALVSCNAEESSEPHTHAFAQKNIVESFLKSVSADGATAEYYYSCDCGEKGEETFMVGVLAKKNQDEEETEHVHDYTQRIPDVEFLKNAAKCDTPAEYYYVCACGLRGTKSYASELYAAHKYSAPTILKEATAEENGMQERTCERCGHKETVDIAVCSDCGGDGKAPDTCGKCRGSGRFCTTCDGKGSLSQYKLGTCSDCNGSGQKAGSTCGTCAGSGYARQFVSSQQCKICKGAGVGSSVPALCQTCDGDGKVDDKADCGKCEQRGYYAAYRITYDANGGVNAPAEQVKTADSCFLSNNAPHRDGYVFVGWATGDGTGFYKKGALYSGKAVTLYAVWRPMDK